MTRGDQIYVDGEGCTHHGADVSDAPVIDVGGEPSKSNAAPRIPADEEWKGEP